MTANSRPIDVPPHHMEPVQVTYSANHMQIGSFHCPVGHTRWRTENHVGGQAIMAFGRTMVGIRQQGMPEVCADPTHVMFYNPGVSYTRELADPRGDRCDWFGVEPSIIVDAIAEFDPSVRDRPERPLDFPSGPCEATLYLKLRRLAERVRRAERVDDIDVGESVLALLRSALRAAFDVHRGGSMRRFGSTRQDTMQARRELAANARQVIARTYRQRLTIPDLARQVFTSPHHLCRVFRSESLMSLHQFITELRLRDSLERLLDDHIDLTHLALDLGFASHAHFSTSFKRKFGVTPSEARMQLRRR